MNFFKIKERRVLYLVIFIICIELVSITYVLNYTTRAKNPVWSYHGDEEITSLSMSSTGNSFALGTADGTVLFFKKGKPQPKWAYHGSSRITSLAMSAEGDFLAVLEEDTISIFFEYQTNYDDDAAPRWTFQLPVNKIEGFYSSRAMLPSVTLLLTTNGSIKYISIAEDLSWEYPMVDENIVSTLSSNGVWVVAGDSQGCIYLFKARSSELIWKITTQLNISSVETSFDNRYIVAGGIDRQFEREVIIIALRDGVTLWRGSVEGQIEDIFVSNDGSRIFLDQGEGMIKIIKNEGGLPVIRSLDLKRGINNIIAPTFGSNVIASDTRGNVYSFHIPRTAPLWKTKVDDESPLIVISSSGDYIILGDAKNLHLYTNLHANETLSGSRIGWSVIFSIGAVGIVVVTIVKREEPIKIDLVQRDLIVFSVGFCLGSVLSYLVYRTFNEAFVIGGLSFGLGLYLSWRGGDIIHFFSGSVLGVNFSIVGGTIIGLILWFAGDERSIIQLMFIYAVNGVKVGIFFGPVGAFIGIMLVNSKYLIARI